MSEVDSIVSQPPLRILSLDGGGYRGLSSLTILQRLMEKLKRDDGSIPLPCEVFDFIIGTSTGGLIAILLGRLRYSVKQAIQTYLDLGKDIFGELAEISKDPKHWFECGVERFNPDRFEKVLHDLTRNDPLLLDTRADNQCKVVVLTTEGDAVDGPPVLLRSYPTDERLLPNNNWVHDWTIKEAARATSAAPTYFPPIHINDHGVDKYFRDAGAAGYNNPVRQAIIEVRNRIPEFKGRQISCVVSLGTGLGDLRSPMRQDTNTPPPVGSGIVWNVKYSYWFLNNGGPFMERVKEFSKYLVDIASDTFKAHEEMTYDEKLRTVYFRADVPGLGKYDLADISMETKTALQEETTRWLNNEDGAHIIDACVERMKSQTIPSLELNPAVFGKPTCVGRADVIEQLSEIISSAHTSENGFQPRSALIKGYLGIGKSTVALQVMHDPRVRRVYGNRICYIRCDGVLDIASLKGKLLAMRKVNGGRAVDDDIRQLLSAAPTLICLDNFEHLLFAPGGIRSAIEAELLPLIALNASLIVTVRGIPNIQLGVTGGWSSCITLSPLDAAFSRTAFLQYAGQAPGDEEQTSALNTLLEKCDGHPLAISLIARNIIGTQGFTDAVARLSVERDDAIADRLDSDAHTGSLGASVRLSVENHVRETPAAMALCYVLAMLPDGASPTFLERALNPNRAVVVNAKAILIERGLAYEEPARKFLRMLDPLRMFFDSLEPNERAAYGIDALELRGIVRSFHFTLAQQSIFHCPDNESRRLLFFQARNVEAVVMRDLEDLPSDPSALVSAVDAACGVSAWYGWNGEPHATPYLLRALEIVKAKSRDDPLLVSQLLLQIGRDLSDKDAVKAIATLTEVYDLCMECMSDPEFSDNHTVFGQRAAIASEERAGFALAMGDLEPAEAWAEEAIGIYDSFGNEQGIINASITRSQIQAQRGETGAAVDSYTLVLKLATKVGDHIGQANICRSLAQLVPEARRKIEMLERAAELCDGLEWVDDAAACRAEIVQLQATGAA